MKSVHEPVRECICCGEKFAKKDLVRIVKNENGIFVDFAAKEKGRGAYICKSAACLDKLVQQKRLSRAFRCYVDSQVYDTVIKELSATVTE